MKIEVHYDDFVGTYTSLEEAKEAILDAQANGVGVDNVSEVDDEGEVIATYGCSWDVTLEKLQ